MRRFLAVSAFALLACNQALGIDSATVDPALGGAAGAAGATGGEGDGTCADYCDTIMTACTDARAEYISKDVCLAMCQHFEPGVPGDTSQDSLACRDYHAHAALGDPETHCRHAGPLGGGVCGSDPCAPFCTLVAALCDDETPPPYANGEIDCRQACTANTNGASFTYHVTGGFTDLGETDGDTLNCRLYHLESAYAGDAAKHTHCPHTAVVSATCYDAAAK